MAVLLIIHLSLFLLGMDAGAFASITVFCTGPASSGMGMMFGVSHLLFMGLFVVGIVSLGLNGARLAYIRLLTVAVSMLPVQAAMVSNGTFSSDFP